MPKAGAGSFSTCFTIDALIGSGTTSKSPSTSSLASSERLRWWSGLGLAAAAAVQHIHTLPPTIQSAVSTRISPTVCTPSPSDDSSVTTGDELQRHAFRVYRRLQSNDDVIDKARFLTPPNSLHILDGLSGRNVNAVTPEVAERLDRSVDGRDRALHLPPVRQQLIENQREFDFRLAASADGDEEQYSVMMPAPRVPIRPRDRIGDVAVRQSPGGRSDTAAMISDAATSASSLFLLQQSTGIIKVDNSARMHA